MRDNEINSVNDLEEIKLIGSGSYGKVFQMRNIKTQKFYAVKILAGDDDQADAQVIKRETDFLSDCSCPNITSYYGSFYVQRDVWIVMEFIDGGSVSNLIYLTAEKKLQEVYVCVIVREVAKGLDYLHSNGKIHRDIKGANILVSCAGDVKLADFGVSTMLSDSVKRNTFIGSPFWMAPEIIKQEDGYLHEVDIWSLGSTIVEMISGKPLYKEEKYTDALRKIATLKTTPVFNGVYSKTLKSLVIKCFSLNPSERPSAKDILKSKCIASARPCSVLAEFVTTLKANYKSDSGNSEYGKLENDHQKLTTSENMSPWEFDTIKVKNTIKLENHTWDTDTIRKNHNVDFQETCDTIRAGQNIKLDLTQGSEDEQDDSLEIDDSKFVSILNNVSRDKPEFQKCTIRLIECVKKNSLLRTADDFCDDLEEVFGRAQLQR